MDQIMFLEATLVLHKIVCLLVGQVTVEIPVAPPTKFMEFAVNLDNQTGPDNYFLINLFLKINAPITIAIAIINAEGNKLKYLY